MTIKQMVELVQQHHPDVSPNIIRTWINERRRELAFRSGLQREYVQFTTVSGDSMYQIPSTVIDIFRVDYNGERISRLPGEAPYMENSGSGGGYGEIVPGP